MLQRFEGATGQLNYRLEQLIEVVRVAAAKASGEQERGVYVRGVNSRPLWSPVLKAVERERALIRNTRKPEHSHAPRATSTQRVRGGIIAVTLSTECE